MVYITIYSVLAVLNLVTGIIDLQQNRWGWAVIQLGFGSLMLFFTWKLYEQHQR